MKQYEVTYQVGKVKYLLSFHDGESKNNDGSDFWGAKCFNNKKKLQAEIKELESQGYKRRLVLKTPAKQEK